MWPVLPLLVKDIAFEVGTDLHRILCVQLWLKVVLAGCPP